MKLHFYLLIAIVTAFSCSSNDEEFEGETNITINFSHYWDEDEITENDYGTITYTNDSFNQLSIDDISYVISEMYLENSSGTVISLEDFLFINPKTEQNTTYSIANKLLIEDTYSLYFRFGLADENNVSGTNEILDNEGFNLDEQYAGGYFFMKLDGQFIASDDTISDYEYHMIRPTQITIDTVTITDTDTITDTTTITETSTTTVDTSFLVDAGDFTLEGNSATVNVKVDLSEWFTDPNDWDLNELNTMLLKNYEAQLDMEQNGDSVFNIID